MKLSGESLAIFIDNSESLSDSIRGDSLSGIVAALADSFRGVSLGFNIAIGIARERSGGYRRPPHQEIPHPPRD